MDCWLANSDRTTIPNREKKGASPDAIRAEHSEQEIPANEINPQPSPHPKQ